jgi:hypothetical protein
MISKQPGAQQSMDFNLDEVMRALGRPSLER